ncbi:MAG: ABC transporter ATP-binding protein [Lachnospiraceae bacterium]|nr:ABC transporter ATP-binding protein [Lachnospiraceae bacterium]
MLEVNKIKKVYGDHTALRDLSFCADAGKIIGFLGPNGAGKTTGMNIFSGYMQPTSGTVRICGFDVASDRKKAMENVGYLPENPPLYPEMTVEEYLRFTSELKKLKGKKAVIEAERVMELTQTAQERRRLIGQLSKGTRQRVAIAGVLSGSPKLLLLDEPANGLDPGQAAMFKKILMDLKRVGSTVVVSSHILSRLSEVCDELLIINRGRLIAAGTVSFFEKKMNGGGLIVDIAGSVQECEKALMPLRKLCDVRPGGKSASGANTYVLSGFKEDIKKQLFDAVAAEGLYIDRLVKEGKTLEEIYLGMIEASEAEFEKARRRAEKKRAEIEKEGEEDEDNLF